MAQNSSDNLPSYPPHLPLSITCTFITHLKPNLRAEVIGIRVQFTSVECFGIRHLTSHSYTSLCLFLYLVLLCGIIPSVFSHCWLHKQGMQSPHIFAEPQHRLNR